MLITVHNLTYRLGLSLSMRFLLNLVFVNVTAKNCEILFFHTTILRLHLRLADRKRNRKRVVAKPLVLYDERRKKPIYTNQLAISSVTGTYLVESSCKRGLWNDVLSEAPGPGAVWG